MISWLLERLNGNYDPIDPITKLSLDPGKLLMPSDFSQRLYDYVRSQLLSKAAWDKMTEKDVFIRSKPDKDMSEAEVVALWRYVVIALSGDRLNLKSGEVASQSSRSQRALMKADFDINPGCPNYGRKVDLQCTVDKYEINNSELKAGGASDDRVKIQLRKNLRLNHFVALYIHE
ncbi:hypothetical protein EC968_005613 [Mortierella alpina]|nr:hypothetical protein EC968_005613 [Mortierella alpina]